MSGPVFLCSWLRPPPGLSPGEPGQHPAGVGGALHHEACTGDVGPVEVNHREAHPQQFEAGEARGRPVTGVVQPPAGITGPSLVTASQTGMN